jgi:hypothetical protein
MDKKTPDWAVTEMASKCNVPQQADLTGYLVGMPTHGARRATPVPADFRCY